MSSENNFLSRTDPSEEVHDRAVRALPDPRPGYGYHGMMSGEVYSEGNGTTTLLAYGQLLYRHRGKILIGAVLGIILGLTAATFQTPVYRARVALEIQGVGENFMNLREQDPTDSVSTAATAEAYFQTQVKVLQSNTLIERVVAKLHLDPATMGARKPSSLAALRGWFGRVDSPGADRQRFVQSFSDRLTLRTPAQTHIVEVFFDSEDAQFSADFANTLVQEFVSYSREMRWDSAQTTATWLTTRLNEMKIKLEASEAKLQAYAKTAGLLVTSDSGRLAELKLRQLQDELARAQADRADKQSRYEMASSRANESLPTALQNGPLMEYRVKLTDLQRELAELTSTLTPEHYRVRRVEAQIDQLNAAIEQEKKNVLASAAGDDASARRREMLLAQAYAQQARVVADQANKAIQYDTLKHEVDTNNQIYSALLQRVQQAGFASTMRAGNILIVDAADRPFLPYSPSFPLNAAMGLFGGTFLGVGLVLLRERFDNSFRAPGLAPVYLKVPELGVIPRFHKRPGRTFPISADKSSTPLMLPRLVSTDTPHGAVIADSFRATLSSLLLPGLAGETARAIVVTSPDPNVGKTTITAHLGIAAAEIGRRVLLVDGDLRRPRLHGIFNLPAGWGLSDLLRSDVDLESAPLTEIVRDARRPGLSVLPSGAPTENPTQLLYSERMVRLLRRFTREFDLVLIDAPPLVHLADARILGRIADGVILAFRAGHTTRQAAALAGERLAEDGTRVLGTILNGWDYEQDSYYAYVRSRTSASSGAPPNSNPRASTTLISKPTTSAPAAAVSSQEAAATDEMKAIGVEDTLRPPVSVSHPLPAQRGQQPLSRLAAGPALSEPFAYTAPKTNSMPTGTRAYTQGVFGALASGRRNALLVTASLFVAVLAAVGGYMFRDQTRASVPLSSVRAANLGTPVTDIAKPVEAQPAAELPPVRTSTAPSAASPSQPVAAASAPKKNVTIGKLQTPVRRAVQPAPIAAEPPPVIAATVNLPSVSNSSLLLGAAGTAPAPPPSASRPVVGGRIEPPQLISSTPPVYPTDARARRVQGVVVLDALIDEAGNVVEAKPVAGPGPLQPAAQQAVQTWKYRPARLNEQPVQVRLKVNVRFALK